MRQAGRYKGVPAFYDAEYVTDHVLDHDVPFLLARLPERPAAVLELCCGTGRAAVPLAAAGHRVTGVDYDAGLLKLAAAKRDAAGLDAERLTLVRQNVLKLDLPGRYDWAVLLFNTLLNFTTLPVQDRLLDGVRRHLKPGGRFWVDVFNPDFTSIAAAEGERTETAEFYAPLLDRTVRRTTRIRRSGVQVQRMTCDYAWTDPDGTPHERTSAFDLTWMLPREVVLVLERHGFEVEALYGDYDGSEVRPDSPRVIACGRLNAAREQNNGQAAPSP